jgi:hypothetical protein
LVLLIYDQSAFEINITYLFIYQPIISISYKNTLFTIDIIYW